MVRLCTTSTDAVLQPIGILILHRTSTFAGIARSRICFPLRQFRSSNILVFWSVVMPTSATPSFSDNFTSLSLHQTWQSGDKWSLIAPDTPAGRGGPIYNENGDQWWTNPYNTITPISGLYTLAAGGGLQLGLLPT